MQNLIITAVFFCLGFVFMLLKIMGFAKDPTPESQYDYYDIYN